eukprot:gb/GECG01007963.1/.p1 GENE.gb/GECG01007963.1/~~gb/GECG01007963.1/.p1  ORF type:complete len:437 (+),score=21.97 gb/GECG01007963.1/:1-1311(+)
MYGSNILVSFKMSRLVCLVLCLLYASSLLLFPYLASFTAGTDASQVSYQETRFRNGSASGNLLSTTQLAKIKPPSTVSSRFRCSNLVPRRALKRTGSCRPPNKSDNKNESVIVDYDGSCGGWVVRRDESFARISGESDKLILATLTSTHPPFLIAVPNHEEDEPRFCILRYRQNYEGELTRAVHAALTGLIVPLQGTRPVVFIDVGCNAAWASLYASQFGVAKIICIEANPQLEPRIRFSRLLNSVSYPPENFHLVSAPVSSLSTPVCLHWGRHYGGASITNGDCNRTGNMFPLDSVKMDNLLGVHSPFGYSLVGEDGACKSRLVVKIDVEGVEFNVLEGMKRLLPCVEFLYVELEESRSISRSGRSTADIFRLLESDAGLRLSGTSSSLLNRKFGIDSIYDAIKLAVSNKHHSVSPDGGISLKGNVNAIFLRPSI